MNSVPLRAAGYAVIPISVATFAGTRMSPLRFLVDTGATVTTIPKATFIYELGYSEDWIVRNKVYLLEGCDHISAVAKMM
jgi:hypothetical protein